MSITTCRHCSTGFLITDDDRAFLDKLSPVIAGEKLHLPEPTLCPDCRLQRRLSQVNHINLYERTCDFSGKKIVSNIHPSSRYKVYQQEDWYSDAWDAFEYGRDFDFGRPFFEQWNELVDDVPRPNLMTGYEFDENCTYTNYAGKNKNCYLIFDSDENRDCYYSYSLNGCVDCVDCFRARKSELCYGCVDCVKCYGSIYLQDCDNCSDSAFLKNCTGCKNCIMCSNLKNKEYYVENKPVTKQQFEEFRTMLGSHSTTASAIMQFEKMKLTFPQKFMHGVQNEDVTGDYLVNCKNASHCFDSEDLWDCRHVYQGFMPLKDCMDIHECGDAELLYECSVAGYGLKNCCFCNHTLANMNEMIYCTLCHHSKNCFACVGIRRKQYCIFNKQYTKEEYDVFVPKIVEHMRKTGEWGEFFPATTATFAYNESLAQRHFPLTKHEVENRDWKWLDDIETKEEPTGTVYAPPDSIDDVRDDVTKKILRCDVTGKPFKIIPQELAFYRRLRLPLPRQCFFERNKQRHDRRNSRTLYDRACAKCVASIQTTYAPEQPEIVHCEACYLDSLI